MERKMKLAGRHLSGTMQYRRLTLAMKLDMLLWSTLEAPRPVHRAFKTPPSQQKVRGWKKVEQ
jgi:hypothetical protein